MSVGALRRMIYDTFPEGDPKRELIDNLEEGSKFLDTQREAVASLWSTGSEVFIASFYETEPTKTVDKTKEGTWDRVGPKEQTVRATSAQMFWPGEQRIPVPSNHTDMVKFCSNMDETYRITIARMMEQAQQLGRSNLFRSWIYFNKYHREC